MGKIDEVADQLKISSPPKRLNPLAAKSEKYNTGDSGPAGPLTQKFCELENQLTRYTELMTRLVESLNLYLTPTNPLEDWLEEQVDLDTLKEPEPSAAPIVEKIDSLNSRFCAVNNDLHKLIKNIVT